MMNNCLQQLQARACNVKSAMLGTEEVLCYSVCVATRVSFSICLRKEANTLLCSSSVGYSTGLSAGPPSSSQTSLLGML